MQEELFLLFERYLNDEFTNEEKITFEKQLLNDIKVNEQFQLYKETSRLLENKFSKETHAFKANLKSISKNHFTNTVPVTSKTISMKHKWFAVAAMLVVSLGIWIFNTNEELSYSDYNQHEVANFTERSDINQNIVEAQTFFNAKQYKKANESFAKMKKLTNPELQLFYAISLIETNNFLKAKILLEKIINGKSVYKQDAIWYLSLSFLKQKKYDDCKNYLKRITDDSEKHYKAQILLSELD